MAAKKKAASKKKTMTVKQKKDTAKGLGTGGARKAADALINREQQMKMILEGAGASRKKPSAKKKRMVA